MCLLLVTDMDRRRSPAQTIVKVNCIFLGQCQYLDLHGDDYGGCGVVCYDAVW
jgi:hypothetical protein